MGLDMDLYALKTDYNAKGDLFDKYPKELQYARKNCTPTICVQTRYAIAYWRKAYVIHKYFSELRGAICTDAETYVVMGAEVLETLVKLCKEVLNNHNRASELLPQPYDEEYDEYYFDKLEKTIFMVEPAIEAIKRLGKGWEILYEAHW